MSVKSVYYLIGKLEGEQFFMYVKERGFRYLVVSEYEESGDLKLFQSHAEAKAYGDMIGDTVIDLENCDLFCMGKNDDIMRKVSAN